MSGRIKINHPSDRAVSPTRQATLKPKGRLAVKSRSVTTAGISISIPDKAEWMILQNQGSNHVKFNFNSDDPSDYGVVEAQTTFPHKIPLADSVIINLKAISGSSTLAAIFGG